MGMAKRQMEEDEARGWSSAGEKWCCVDHVEDEALEELIAGNVTSKVCSYCGCEQNEPFAAAVDLIVERIATSVPFEWGGADDEGVGREGGYVDKTLDTWTLITDGLEWPLNDSGLIADVSSALPEIAWVQRDYYALSPSDRLLFGWDQFGLTVKHRSRYFFSGWKPEQRGPFPDRDCVSPGELLSAIGEAVVAAGLVRELSLEDESLLYRARMHPRDRQPEGASQLGAPPAKCVVGSSRMSPAGISMFYGALDPDTAVAEARSASPDGEALTLGRFKPLRRLRVVDFSEQPDVPSLFDVERRELRHALIFLRRFVTEIAREFVRDERIHLEYIPTQIVTEWFAAEFRPAGGSVDGLLYQSPRSPGGVNVALFIDDRGCRDPDEVNDDALLMYRKDP